MKKLLITLLAAIFASGALAQTPFPDIPGNHWAGDAVADIAELGIVIGFPDGTFRGNEAFTRYQAALVVDRLLDVIGADLDARMALSEEDVASLRAAVQELASDVAAQGVRLGQVESTVASLSDDALATQGRLDELERALEGVGETDPDVVRDLLNQLASQRVALDTAQAQAEAAEALANNARGAANAAAARARANEDAIAALNSVVQGLGDRITVLEQGARQPVVGGAGVPADLLDRVTRNSADIANIREFVILLRRDQVALRDRVSALEAGDAIQAAQIATLDERVTAIENNPLGLSGSINVAYEVQRLSGGAFDVDRAYGLNNTRAQDASVFSSGTADINGDNDRTDVGEVAQDRADITGADTPATATLSLSAGFGNLFGATGPGGLNQFSGAVDIGLTRGYVCSNAGCTDGADADAAIDTFEGYVFTVDSFTVTFDPIGGDPITFVFGEEVSVELTPYVFALVDEPGFVITAGAPDFLAFLDPSLTIAHSGQDTDADTQLDTFETGVRLLIEPLDGFLLGANVGMAASNAGDMNDVNADNISTTVYGVDGSVSLSIFDIAFEYATSNHVDLVTPANNDTSSVLYVTAGIDASGLPLIETLAFNYRSIDADWFTGNRGLNTTGGAPFAADQMGFGVEAGLDLFILDVTAYYDSYTTTAPAANVSAFGVDADADLFAGFVLTAWYHQASVNGTTVDNTTSGVDANEAVVVPGVSRGTNYDTGFGVGVRHDGVAENALIPGLNLGVEYSQSEADFSSSRLAADADMTFNVSILTLTPYVAYVTVNDADTPSDDTSTIRAGTGLTTQPLNVFFAPSLEAAVNYRTTTHSDAAAYVASELQWSVGVMLNQFLFDNSTFLARYGSWTGTNVSVADADGEGATDISAGDVMGTGVQMVSGYELVWSYFGLDLAYGVYTADEQDGAGPSAGQVFSISYDVDW